TADLEAVVPPAKTETKDQGSQTTGSGTVMALHAKVKHLEQVIKHLQDKSRDPAAQVIEISSKFMDGPYLKLFEQQVQLYFSRGRGRRWTPEQKMVALALNFKSPAAYDFLRAMFALPSVYSLKRWFCGVECNPGYNKSVLTLLQSKVELMDAKKRVVVVSFDEMLLSERLKYGTNEDMIIGFQDLGPLIGRTNAVATHALVVMVRCLFDTWKQPIGYFLSSSSVEGNILKHIIEEGVKNLLQIGFDVRAIVADQNSNNCSAFAALGVKENEPFFCVDDRRVWCLYDPPRLIKNVRNNLMKYGASFENTKSAQWSHIVDFYKKDSQAAAFSLAPKLTEAHLFTPPFKKMHVCLAARVLSRTVAAGINAHVSAGNLPDSAAHTAEFVAEWNDIFDSVNGRTFKVNEELKRPAKTSSPHPSFWLGSIEWIKDVHFNTSSTVCCLDGWKLTLQAMIGLMRELQSLKNFKFLSTSRLNLDCLDNLFAVIRQKGGNRDDPEPNRFHFAFRQTLSNFLIRRSSSSSCVPDTSSLLLTLSDLNKARTLSDSPPSVPTPPYPATSFDVNDLSYEYSVDTLDSSGVNYVLGYVLKKIDFCCDKCSTSSLYSSNVLGESCQENPHKKALRTTDSDFTGPSVPSRELVRSFCGVHNSVIVPFLSDVTNLVAPRVNSRLTTSVVRKLSYRLLCSDCLSKIVNAYCRIIVYWKIHKLNAITRASRLEKESKKSVTAGQV
ncbi:Transposable element P transposase-like 2, partial [Homarus americanus]